MKSFPFFRQLDAMDCGPASLKIICKHYGKEFSMKYLRDMCNITKEGVSLLDISRTCDNIGLNTLPLKVTFEDLKKKIPLPCIIHWNYSHFVVLYKIKKNKVYVSDPQLGLITYNIKDFVFGWKKNKDKGVVLVIEPSPRFYENEDVKELASFKRYFAYLRPYKGLLLQVFVGLLLNIVLSVLFPFITQSIVDVGIETQDLNFINLLLIASIILTISSVFSKYVQERIMLFIADRVNISMVSDFISKVMKLPYSFFERKMTSDILNRINDHSRIQSFIFGSFLNIVVAIISIVVYSIILVIFNVKIFVFFLIGTILYVLWILLFLKKRRILDIKYFDSNIMNQHEVIQIAENSIDIKINNLEQKKRWDWEKSRLDIYDLNIKLLNLTQTQNIGTTLINQLKNVFITFFAAKAVIEGDMTLGMMMSAQYIIGQLNGPIGQTITFIQSYQDAQISLERVGEVMNSEEEEVVFEGMEAEIPEDKSLSIEKMNFRYLTSGPAVLEDINLWIPFGKMTAIVGESGSGKSTFIKLLLRLYDSYDGDIKVGNANLKSIDIHKWRSICGAVMQDGVIFNDTILNNIILHSYGLNTDRLQKVLEMTNLSSFINMLPLKMYTRLGQGGMGISGGQKQRILIARAIYKNPDFLILDEATNSLDTINENFIAENLNAFSEGRTTIVIAHRLSTIKSADNIVVFDKGRIIEQGTHEKLFDAKGKYYELVVKQLN